MSTPPRFPLKSLPEHPAGPSIAGPAPAASGSRAPKVVGRQAVPVAVLPDPRTVTVTGIRPGLSVRGLGRNEIPMADWLCACGRFERARGRKAVTNLATRARVGQCPHTIPAQSRRSAA
ncbi:hypothetical protein [Streptomyces sp. NBC_01237]|uniref:hypothetical protein n=1 Tax=Streptomyces sp. NBC_01237 TaxID=2903790 RepID=UPI002DDBAC1F|nr:hypothetical protein [Streptomyces sp. NBC_01237]WRZ73005.1 hypothetical protein OG251_15970 [Streptomyces sp. NBC_01237]